LSESVPSSVAYGQRAVVSGRLILTGTTLGLGPEKVTLFQRLPGATAWKVVATSNTGTNGVVTFAVAPKRAEQYELRHAADSATAASTSPVREIKVRYAVAATLTKKSVSPKAADSVSVVVNPGASGATVDLQELVKKTWTKVASTRLGKKSTAVIAFKAPVAGGTYRYRVVKAASKAYLAGSSGTLTLTVR
jgi:hypothetical protein